MHDDFRLPQSRWIALLSIAHRYEFLNMYKRAIREIYDFTPSEYRNAEQKSDTDSNLDADSKLDYVMLISVAEKYDVPLQHVVPTFITLVLRDDPLTDAEAAHLSTLTMCRLARAREHYYRGNTIDFLTHNERRNAAERSVKEIWPLTTTKS